jgi:aspartyl/asparaginyl beta-hydroxylase (cupin superfamily)
MTNPHNSQQAFYNLNDFPKLKALADNWQTIRDEFQILNAPDMGINRTGQEISAMQA